MSPIETAGMSMVARPPGSRPPRGSRTGDEPAIDLVLGPSLPASSAMARCSRSRAGADATHRALALDALQVLRRMRRRCRHPLTSRGMSSRRSAVRAPRAAGDLAGQLVAAAARVAWIAPDRLTSNGSVRSSRGAAPRQPRTVLPVGDEQSTTAVLGWRSSAIGDPSTRGRRCRQARRTERRSGRSTRAATAGRGMVSTQAMRMSPGDAPADRRQALAGADAHDRLEMTWVVETGTPKWDALRMIVAAVVSAAKPWTGSSFDHALTHGLDDPPAPDGRAERDGRRRDQDDPQRHHERRR